MAQYTPNTQMYLFLCSKQVKKRFFYIIYLKSVKGCSSVARLRLKAAGGNERRRRLLPCRVWPVQVAYARTCALKCSLNTRNSPFSLLFGAFNNNFKVFVFIGFVIIYFYNIFALIKGSRVLLMLFFVDFDSNPQSRFHRPCHLDRAKRREIPHFVSG